MEYEVQQAFLLESVIEVHLGLQAETCYSLILEAVFFQFWHKGYMFYRYTSVHFLEAMIYFFRYLILYDLWRQRFP